MASTVTTDNAKKGGRTLTQTALAGFIIEMIEQHHIAQFDGYQELIAVSIVVAVIAYVQNLIEAKTGYKFLAPAVEIAGAEALGQKEVKPLLR